LALNTRPMVCSRSCPSLSRGSLTSRASRISSSSGKLALCDFQRVGSTSLRRARV